MEKKFRGQEYLIHFNRITLNLQENYSIIIIIISLVLILFLTNYFNKISYSLSITLKQSYLSFPFLFLSTVWWKNKRIWLAPVFLAILLIFIQVVFYNLELPLGQNYFSIVMLIFVVVIFTFLSERIEKVRSLSILNEKLDKEKVKLEDANRELDSFAYSVSHDLRVPLRAIDGFSRILIEDYEDEIDEEGKRLINVVRENTRKMSQLIDDILQLSRVSRQEIKKSKIDMESLVKQIFDELKPPDRHIQLNTKSLPIIYGDRALIQQVVLNLISNSIKFTKTRESAVIEVSGERFKDEIIYYVKDNGVGFDMKYVSKLFGLFQRLHSQDEFEGTGVGLSIVQRIIKRHGGRVWGESKIEEGATIYFTLPIKG